ncbi:MAG TPA: HlyD family secretion protein [Opitutaceae bacterium]|jgi:membrane fusion protein (multidrug efflux system)
MSTNSALTTASLSSPIADPLPKPKTAKAQPGRLIAPSRWAMIAAGALFVVLAAFYGWQRLQFSFAHIETDDAQVEGDISPVLPRVSGYVTDVLVRDNQKVVAGQPLLEIDARELDLKVVSASAALSTARAALATSEATVEKARAALLVAQASVSVAAVRHDKGDSDLNRDTSLFQNGAITDRQLSDTRAAADIARAELAAAEREAAAARSDVGVAEAQVAASRAAVAARGSDVDYAKLERSYATIVAPIDGVVSRKNVELGQYVQAGQTLLSIASETGVWIVANYKETQMEHMHVGQTVDIDVDSYPGVVFHGRIDSIAGATGARFALLPPDNASGNFIKVTQRVPVKIVISDRQTERPLRAGMSVDTAVAIKS